MNVFGLTITRSKKLQKSWPVPIGAGGWWPIWPNVQEPYTGAWQANASTATESLLSQSAVFACISLIASDIAKMRLRLVVSDRNGVWEETERAAFSPVLRRPNSFQNRIQFIERWLISKLVHGNTYVLKTYSDRSTVEAMHILNPQLVRVLISDDGSVFYSLSPDALQRLEVSQIVPARFIIHDRMVTLYHPLIGVSPIHACAMAAIQGLKIQANSTKFFSSGSNPGGVLTAPGSIDPAVAKRIKEYWDTNFTGDNVGKVAVLGDGLEYKALGVNAHDSQLIEQLKWTAETVCSCFHVPPYMIGIGPMPTYNNIEALNAQYYAQCLQTLIEHLELSLDEGLALPSELGTEFDLDDLLRMDSASLVDIETKAITGGLKSPNEGRRRMNMKPVKGGDTPYLQQQNYSLAALAERDALGPAPQSTTPPPNATPTPEPPKPKGFDEDEAIALWRLKHHRRFRTAA